MLFSVSGCVLSEKSTSFLKTMNSTTVLFMIFNVIHFCGTEDDKSYWKRGHKHSTSEMGAESKQSYFQDDVLSRKISTRSESTARDRREHLPGSDFPSELQDGAEIEDGTKNGNVKYKPAVDPIMDIVKTNTSRGEQTLTKRYTSGRSTNVTSFPIKEHRLSSTRSILNRSKPLVKNPTSVEKSSDSTLKNCGKGLEPLTTLCLTDFHAVHKIKTIHSKFKQEKGSLKTSEESRYRSAKVFSKFKKKKEKIVDNNIFMIPYLNDLSSNLKLRSKRGITKRKTGASVSSNFTTDNKKKSSKLSRVYQQNRKPERAMFPRDTVYSLTNKRVILSLEDQTNSSKKQFNKAKNLTNLDLVSKLVVRGDEENKSAEISSRIILDSDHTSQKLASELKSYIKIEKISHKTKRTATQLTSASKMILPITDAPLQIWKDDPIDFLADSGLPASSKSSWPVRRVCEVS